jgi:hypothetical protein
MVSRPRNVQADFLNRIGRFLQLDLKIPGNTIVVYIFIHWGAQSDQSTRQET